MIAQTTVRPSVWIGCLACYNQGLLNGQWFPAEEAGEVTPEDLHCGPTYHDELWIFDHEGFPRGTGEMSPTAAVQWGEAFDEAGEEQWPALLAWVDTGCYIAEGDVMIYRASQTSRSATVAAGTRSRTTRHSSLRTSA